MGPCFMTKKNRMTNKHNILLYNCAGMNLLPRLIFRLSSSSSNFPKFYNQSLSLSSNIQQANSMANLFELHTSMRRYYTPSLLAIAARQLISFVGIAQKRSEGYKHKAAYIPKDNLTKWEQFLKHLYSLNPQEIPNQNIIDFLYFSYKIRYYRIPLGHLFPKLTPLHQEFKAGLVKVLAAPSSINHLSIPQLVDCFYYLQSFMWRQGMINVLTQIKKELLRRPYCTCFHLIMLTNTIIHVQVKDQNQALNQLCTQTWKVALDVMRDQLKQIMHLLSLSDLMNIFTIFDHDKDQQTKAEVLLKFESKVQKEGKNKLYLPHLSVKLKSFRQILRRDGQKRILSLIGQGQKKSSQQ